LTSAAMAVALRLLRPPALLSLLVLLEARLGASTVSGVFADFLGIGKKAEELDKAAGAEEKLISAGSKAYCKLHEADPVGTPCCAKSTCYWDDKYPMQKLALKIPDVACDKTRGSTKCEGGSLFPVPKAGICVCTKGHCISGKCQEKAGGLLGELEGLFEVPDSGSQPTPSSAPLWPWCACVLAWTSFGMALHASVHVARSCCAHRAKRAWERLTVEDGVE